MTDALKSILEQTKLSGYRRVLVLFPKKADREAFRVELANVADEVDLPYYYQAGNSITRVGDVMVHLRLAHDNIDRELRGVQWDAIYGLESLEPFPNGVDIAIVLQSMVRQ